VHDIFTDFPVISSPLHQRRNRRLGFSKTNHDSFWNI